MKIKKIPKELESEVYIWNGMAVGTAYAPETFLEGFDAGVQFARGQWIRVEDRLPSEPHPAHVMVAIKSDFDEKGASKGFGYALYSDKYGWSIDDDHSGNPEVVAWMLLPEPYQPTQEETNVS